MTYKCQKCNAVVGAEGHGCTPAPLPTLPGAISGLSPANPLARQEGGDHYKKLKIQPLEYIHANAIPFAEGSVIKYVSRWRDKGGIKDLQKAKHFIELLIELETRKVEQ